MWVYKKRFLNHLYIFGNWKAESRCQKEDTVKRTAGKRTPWIPTLKADEEKSSSLAESIWVADRIPRMSEI